MSELRHAALLAEAHLVLDAAQKYGLVTGGPQVNVERCEQLIAEAHSAGIVFTSEEVGPGRGRGGDRLRDRGHGLMVNEKAIRLATVELRKARARSSHLKRVASYDRGPRRKHGRPRRLTAIDRKAKAARNERRNRKAVDR